MNTLDPKLSELLQQWKSIEPQLGFEERVLRRIRKQTTVIQAFRWLQPLTALAAMVIAAFISYSPRIHPSGGVLAKGSVTASYVQIEYGVMR